SARLPSRQDAAGEMLLLEQQDRTQWDQMRIAEGIMHLDLAAQGEDESVYHIEAAIAGAHYLGAVGWTVIVGLYDRMIEIKNTTVVLLNRAVAVAKRDGALAGIQLLQAIEGHPNMRGYYLLPAVMAELWAEAGDRHKALLYFGEALACECTDPE